MGWLQFQRKPPLDTSKVEENLCNLVNIPYYRDCFISFLELPLRPKFKRYIMTQKFNDGRWSRRIDVADFVYSKFKIFRRQLEFIHVLQFVNKMLQVLW